MLRQRQLRLGRFSIIVLVIIVVIVIVLVLLLLLLMMMMMTMFLLLLVVRCCITWIAFSCCRICSCKNKYISLTVNSFIGV